MYMIVCVYYCYTLQVLSIQQEFESIQSRGIHHPNLVQYLTMNHTYHEDDNKISVEVCNKLFVFRQHCMMLYLPSKQI